MNTRLRLQRRALLGWAAATVAVHVLGSLALEQLAKTMHWSVFGG